MADEIQATLKYGVYMRGPVDGVVSDEPLARFSHADMAEKWAREHHDLYVVLPLERPDEQPTEPRTIIRHFAAAMERKLAANDGKGGWRIATKQANMMRWKALRHLTALRNEVGELEQAVIDMDSLRKEANAEQVQDILMEAADVALYALMIADVVGALPPTDERGR